MKHLSIVVMAAVALFFSTLTLAQPSPEQMLALKHANPMPNLMRVAMANAGELKLSDRQKVALQAWHKENRPKMMEMVKTVLKLEKELHDAALAGAPGSALQEIASRVFNVRGAIIKHKLACRNRMAQILNPEQMKKVIALYKARG